MLMISKWSYFFTKKVSQKRIILLHANQLWFWQVWCGANQGVHGMCDSRCKWDPGIHCVDVIVVYVVCIRPKILRSHLRHGLGAQLSLLFCLFIHYLSRKIPSIQMYWPPRKPWLTYSTYVPEFIVLMWLLSMLCASGLKFLRSHLRHGLGVQLSNSKFKRHSITLFSWFPCERRYALIETMNSIPQQ